MKRLILLVLVMVVGAQAQFAGVFWGKKNNAKITTGNVFERTDSLKIKVSGVYLSDSIATTLYTDMMYIDNRSRGVGVVTVSLDSVDSPMDSAATVWWRFYDDKDVHTNQYWDVWYQVGAYHKTDTLYIYDLADSTWWRAARGGQMKFIKFDADDDTCQVNLGFYAN